MTTERKQIRNTVTQLLLGNTLAEDRVFASRAIPVSIKNLPSICVYTDSENTFENGEAPRAHRREIDLICEIKTGNPESDAAANDQCDDIAEQVEAILFAQDADRNSKLGCLVNAIALAGVSMEYESQGDATVNSCRLSFNVEYYKDAVTGEAPNTTDLDRMGVDWEVGTANDPDPEAQDIIELDP